MQFGSWRKRLRHKGVYPGRPYNPPGEGMFFMALTFIGVAALILAWYSAYVFFSCNAEHHHLILNNHIRHSETK